jgi:hypothetical protein
MKMKKHSVLMGLLSVLLMAGLMFSACPMEDDDDDDGGLDVPGAGDLPGLPEDPGIEYVATVDEAKVLLGKMKDGFGPMYDAYEVAEKAEDKAKDESTDRKYSYEVKGDTSVSGFKVNANGRYSWSSNLDSETVKEIMSGRGDPVSLLTEGKYMEQSYNSYIAVDFTSDTTESGVTILKGGSSKQKTESNGRVTRKNETTISAKDSSEDSRTGGLTVYSGGKGGKIILEAKQEYSASGDIDVTEWPGDDDTEPTYSGFLAVYGKDNKEVYKLNIINAQTYGEALGYFVPSND